MQFTGCDYGNDMRNAICVARNVLTWVALLFILYTVDKYRPLQKQSNNPLILWFVRNYFTYVRVEISDSYNRNNRHPTGYWILRRHTFWNWLTSFQFFDVNKRNLVFFTILQRTCLIRVAITKLIGYLYCPEYILSRKRNESRHPQYALYLYIELFNYPRVN